MKKEDCGLALWSFFLFFGRKEYIFLFSFALGLRKTNITYTQHNETYQQQKRKEKFLIRGKERKKVVKWANRRGIDEGTFLKEEIYTTFVLVKVNKTFIYFELTMREGFFINCPSLQPNWNNFKKGKWSFFK